MQEQGNLRRKKIWSGVGVGFASSVFGGGGGMLAVPMLKGAGMEEKQAHATAILLILPVALVSFLFYLFKGAYEPSVLLPTALGVTGGGLLGAMLLDKLPVKTVRLIFTVLQLIAGISLLFF